MNLYPNIKNLTPSDVKGKAIEKVIEVIDFVTRQRVQDVREWDNLPQRFILGRKVGRVPSSSADVIAGDKVGDFNVTATYAYFLIDNGGTAAWRRVAVSSW